ncbi:MAG: hypothetical protein MI755_16395 [Sphingomonadales bacterium]|nr:hypothetical protein [Sphingomonadales bacterium]
MTTITRDHDGHRLTLTDEYPASSQGQAVLLVDDNPTTYGPSDLVDEIRGGIYEAISDLPPVPLPAYQIVERALFSVKAKYLLGEAPECNDCTLEQRFIDAGRAQYAASKTSA